MPAAGTDRSPSAARAQEANSDSSSPAIGADGPAGRRPRSRPVACGWAGQAAFAVLPGLPRGRSRGRGNVTKSWACAGRDARGGSGLVTGKRGTGRPGRHAEAVQGPNGQQPAAGHHQRFGRQPLVHRGHRVHVRTRQDRSHHPGRPHHRVRSRRGRRVQLLHHHRRRPGPRRHSLRHLQRPNPDALQRGDPGLRGTSADA
jgi:hypothetical protein